MGWHGGMHADCDATKRHRGATKERVPSSRQLANRPLRRRRTRRTEPDVRALLGKLGELQQKAREFVSLGGDASPKAGEGFARASATAATHWLDAFRPTGDDGTTEYVDSVMHAFDQITAAASRRASGYRSSVCANSAELKLLHFDTRQYLHFGWSTHAELRERLELHIRATIPGRATAKRRGKG